MGTPVTTEPTAPVRPMYGPEPPGPPRGWVVAVLTALAGLAGGYLLGASSTSAPTVSDVPDVAPITLVAAPVDAAPPTSRPVTPAEPAPVITPVAAGAPLADLVPGFRGTLWISGLETDPDPRARVWTWPFLLTEPAASPLDLGTDLAMFDASGGWIAVVTTEGAEARPVLRAGDAARLSRVMDGVDSFAWHATRPGELAWIAPRVGSRPPEINTGTVDTTGAYFRPVTPLDDLPATGPVRRLTRYDDHGFVIEESSTDPASRLVTSRVITFDSAGNTLGALTGVYRGGARDGTIAVAVEDPETGEITTPLLSRRLQPAGQLPWAADSAVVWAHDGSTAATVVNLGERPVLHVGPDRLLELPLNVSWAQVLTWSPDGQFVVMRGGGRPSRPVMIIADVAHEVVYYLLTGIFLHQAVVAP